MPSSSSLGFVSRNAESGVVRNALAPANTVQIVAGKPRTASSTSSSSTDDAGSMPRVLHDVVVPVPRTTLTLWNVAMFLFHAGLATLTLTLGKWELTAPTYKTVLDFRYRDQTGSGDDADGGFIDASSGSGDHRDRPWELVPLYQRSDWDLPITALVALFFVLSASAHLLNATLLRSWYLSELERCRTPTRWIEYSLSAPTMIVIIAYSLGVRSRTELLAITTLVSITMPFGYWVEVVARPASHTAWTLPLHTRLLPWWLGHLPQTVAWLLIILQFYDGADPVDKAPDFVHVILWTELVLFFSFGFASLWSQLQPPERFYQGELLFQILSLVSKGLLGSLLIANVLMLSRFDDLYNDPE